MAKKKPQNKKFVFEISFEDLLYDEAGAIHAYGGGYDSSWPKETLARESISNLFHDALCMCLNHTCNSAAMIGKDGFTKKNFKESKKYQEKKQAFYEKVSKSLKLARIENI